MKKLLLNLAGWRERLAHEPLAIFLDYDGTLSAIAPTPADAKLSLAMREILKALVQNKNVKVAIISGREFSDLRKMISVKGLSYVGSHGIEFLEKGFTSERISKQYLKELGGLGLKLQHELGGSSEILFEWKSFSLAVHYRKASPGAGKKVKMVVLDICHDAVNGGRISIMFGKKVIEIMPPVVMDKGRALEKLLKCWGSKKYLPIFIGDDRTDEAAFNVLRGRGLTIKVGAPHVRSKAEYYLDAVQDVKSFLRMILHLRSS